MTDTYNGYIDASVEPINNQPDTEEDSYYEITQEDLDKVGSERLYAAGKFVFADSIAAIAEHDGISLDDVDITSDPDTVAHALLERFSEDQLFDIHSVYNEIFFTGFGMAMDDAGSIYVGKEILSKVPLTVETDEKKELDIGSEKVIGGMQFIPFGEDWKNEDVMLDVMALGANDLLAIAKSFEKDKKNDLIIPEYLIGLTNKRMADFVKKHAGFHFYKEKFLPHEIHAEEGELDEDAKSDEEKKYDVIISSDDLIKQIPQIAKQRDRLVAILEKRKGYSLKEAREKAIWHLFSADNLDVIYQLAISDKDFSKYQTVGDIIVENEDAELDVAPRLER